MMNKLVGYMERYDSLHESMIEEMELVTLQSGLLAIAKIMLEDSYDSMETEEKMDFLNKTIDVAEDFIKVSKELSVKFNTLIMINETIGTLAKRLGCYSMLEVDQRNEQLKTTVQLLTDSEHEEFLNKLLKLKNVG